MLKNYRNTLYRYPRFSSIPKTGVSFQKKGGGDFGFTVEPLVIFSFYSVSVIMPLVLGNPQKAEIRLSGDKVAEKCCVVL